MNKGLIGYTGFIGRNLQSQQKDFDALYNSKNISEIEGKTFDILYCAGISGVKWKARQNPKEDWEAIERLLSALKKVKARQFILISTVDIYSNPTNVNEDSEAGNSQCAYGKHRYEAEKFLASHFPEVFIFRLPGLFGTGLKKNIIYDFLHNQPAHIHHASVAQFYDLARLSQDIHLAVGHALQLVNLVTEPVPVQTIARQVFGHEFENVPTASPELYDVHTKHADIYGHAGHYIMPKSSVLQSIQRFVNEERASSTSNNEVIRMVG